ncbi:MAG: hypothetical protein ACOYIQ_01410 [Christensenellales bacterium]|jgi:MFS family permease
MENKIKQFLQSEFQKIPPTQAAAEYRKQLLQELMDYSRELKIKGVANEEVVYDLTIKKLGDMDALLASFEEKRLREKTLKKKKSVAAIISLAILLPCVLVYIILGLAVRPPIWNWSWIILLGGIFAWVSTLLILFMVNNKAKLKKLYIRLSALGIVSLWVVFVSLVFMLINKHVQNIEKWYVSFISLPAFLAVADFVISMVLKSKGKWLTAAADIILFYAMLYVIIVVLHPAFAHPGWMLILLGIAIAGTMLATVNKVKGARQEKSNPNEIDEKYYTEW